MVNTVSERGKLNLSRSVRRKEEVTLRVTRNARGSPIALRKSYIVCVSGHVKSPFLRSLRLYI
jgi:hypothetical protein